MATIDPEVQELLALARHKSRKRRSAVLAAINDIYSDDARTLADEDKRVMEDIIRNLVDDVELSVRRTLAQRLSTRPDAPRDLVNLLANDVIEVALPILLRSEVLRDEELIEIVRLRTMEHQVAVASRRYISAKLSETLAKTDNPLVVETLLRNADAQIPETTMERLVEKSREVVQYQVPLVNRKDLPPHLVKKLYWCVSAALRQHILERHDVDPDELDDGLEAATREAISSMTGSEASDSTSFAKSARMLPLDTERLFIELQYGSVYAFVKEFSRLSSLDAHVLRQILFEPGGERLAILCKAVGIDKHSFGRMLLTFRQGRLGGREVAPDEISSALAFHESIGDSAAERVLRRWQRDPDYQWALDIVEGIEDPGGPATASSRR